MRCVLHVAFLHWRYVLIGRAEIWLDWLKDEIGLVEGDEAEREKIYELFEKAVTDYICKRGTVSVKRLNEQWSDSLAHPIASSEISLVFFFFYIVVALFLPCIWQLKRTAGMLCITDLLKFLVCGFMILDFALYLSF